MSTRPTKDKDQKTRKKKVLFVCVGNTCRSQMAEALARHHASDVLEPSSAGISPFGSIVPPTRRVLAERGVSIAGQSSKGLREVEPDFAELIVNMTGIPGYALFAGARHVEDWEVADPYGEDLGLYRQICDEIEEHVMRLAKRLRREQEARKASD